MPIMTTRVHHTRSLAGIVETSGLCVWQRIHISPQSNHLSSTVCFALDDPDHTCAANAGHHLITAKGPQFFGNLGRCGMGVEHQLRMLMKITPPGCDFVL